MRTCVGRSITERLAVVLAEELCEVQEETLHCLLRKGGLFIEKKSLYKRTRAV